jgi:SPP1 gp7 family putative phage head morphogenesis protein
LLLSKEREEEVRRELSELFDGMMQTLYSQGGAEFRIEVLAKPKVQEFIEAHAGVLDSGFSRVEMSGAMRRRLTRSDYIFSGMKTFHELNEAFPSLLDENGNRKPFERFLNDVRKIDETYNGNYLRAEYNFVQSSAEMAARWEQFMEDGDRYNIQYRTAADGKVRPTHAALHGVTLPITDPFWEEYYPPNGWNCRCTVVQVRKSKYPETPHDEAMALGEEALQKDSKGIFHFNAGKEQKTVPDYNPYTIRRCRDCDVAKGKLKLAFVPDNELCSACQLLRRQQQLRDNRRPTREEFRELNRKVTGWADSNLDAVRLPNSPVSESPAKRTYVDSADGHSIGVGKVFFSEMMHKNKRNPLLPDIVEASMHFREWVSQATRITVESGIHHPFDFSVYRVTWNGKNIEFKCKLTDGELLYNMTFI